MSNISNTPYPTASPNRLPKQSNLTTTTGYRQQNLPPLPNPRHTAHYPRRKNSNPIRGRHPRRPLPHRLKHRSPGSKEPKHTPTTIQCTQRRDNSRSIQLHIQECDPTPTKPSPPWHALILPAQDRRPCLRRRGCCC